MPFLKIRRLLAALLCLSAMGIASAQTKPKPANDDPDAFNTATDTPLLRSGSSGAAVARAQILLDRAWYSSGEIDGRYTANMKRMVRAYQQARGLRATGTLTPETWQSLSEDGEPLLTRYTITGKDAAGPFTKTPADMGERSKMKALVYESLEELLAEKFHTSVAWLRQINKGAKIEAGNEIVVPNVVSGKPPEKAISIQIDKSQRVLYVLDTEKRPVAGFPISIGNEKNDPLPIGTMAIRSEVRNPGFTYNPKQLKSAPRNAQKVEIAPGPNNPLGTIWMGLSKPQWGIHGTPNPSNVGHTETNGYIHMTNWDAERLSQLARAGFRVHVRP